MSITADKVRLSQHRNLEWLKRELKPTDMVTVYQMERDELDRERFIYAVLIPSYKREETLSDSVWDLKFGDGLPCVGGGSYGKQPTKYLRYGVDDGIEPLILYNKTYQAKAPWIEICEEFRHIHRLYHDKDADQYFKFDENSEEAIVATVTQNRVLIRFKELLEYLAVKGKLLSIQFRYLERSEHAPEELGLDLMDVELGSRNTWNILHQEELLCWRHGYSSVPCIRDYQVDSCLEGKRLIVNPPRFERGYFVAFPKQTLPYIESERGCTTQMNFEFMRHYQTFQMVCDEHLKQPLLKPLELGDEHYFHCLRIPASGKPRDFDGLVLGLAKILIDSLNEEVLREMLPYAEQEQLKKEKGIALLEAAFRLNEIEGAEVHVAFLQKLQALRSGKRAYEKRRDSLKIAKHFGIDDRGLTDVFASILSKAMRMLDDFGALVRNGRIGEIIRRNHRETARNLFDDIRTTSTSDRTDASVNHDHVIYKLET